MIDKRKLRQKLDRVQTSLYAEYKDWKPGWELTAELSRSFRGKFFNEKNKQFLRRSDAIVDNILNDCANVLAAGLQSGLTNPTTRWFKFKLRNSDLMQFKPVKEWLYAVENIIFEILLKSNFYKLSPLAYKEMGLFGQPCMVQEENVKTITNFHLLTIGEYMLAANDNEEVDTFVHPFSMTVHELVTKFGYDNLPKILQQAYDNNQILARHNVVHEIMPNFMMNKGKMDAKNKPFLSVYYLSDFREDEGILRISGFDSFPVRTPRWEPLSGEVYAISPAMNGMGMAKSLQKWHLTRHYGVDMQVKPPLNVPSDMYDNGKKPSLIPGGINPYNSRKGDNKVTPTMNVNIDLSGINLSIEAAKADIKTSMLYNLFTAVLNSDKRMTATEVEKVSSEQMVQLGPVLNNITGEFLSPTIIATYNYADKLGALPPPPPELDGAELEIEYISMLAMAQKSVELSAEIDFTQFVGMLTSFDPNARKKLNVYKLIDDYADKRGVNPTIVNSNDEVVELDKAEAAEQQQMQQLAIAKQMLEGAKTMSEIAPAVNGGA